MKNTAVVGYGGQGGWHCNQILKSDVVSLSGIYDIAEDKCKKASENGIKVYASFEEILADKAVDIVVIAVPNDDHKDLVVRALGAGKNVICEKPVAITVADFDQMADAAKKSGKLFSVHQNRRWDVDFLAVKSIIESGEIGDAINIESRIHGSRGIPSDWRCTKKCGGGMILDWGVHLIDQILQIYKGDKITEIFCTTTDITKTEVDDGFKLNLFFESGKTAYIDWTKNAHIAKMKAWNEKEVLPVQTAAGITKTMAPRDSITLDEYDAPRPVSDVHNYYRNFCAAIDKKEASTVKLSEVRRVMQVMEAAFKSAETRQALNVRI